MNYHCNNKKVRSKWYKKYKNKIDCDKVFFTYEKTFKSENKKKKKMDEKRIKNFNNLTQIFQKINICKQ